MELCIYCDQLDESMLLLPVECANGTVFAHAGECYERVMSVARAAEMEVLVEPHRFRPVGRKDLRPGADGRCRFCFVPRVAHPVDYWAPARARGDERAVG